MGLGAAILLAGAVALYFEASTILEVAQGLAGALVTVRAMRQREPIGRAEGYAWIAVFLVLAAFNAAETRRHEVSVNERLETATAPEHQIPQFPMVNAIEFRFGGNSAYVARGYNGHVMQDFIVRFTEGGEIGVDLDIRDASLRVVASLRDSKLKVKAPGYDANSDFEGMEVVDPQQRPVFQLQKMREGYVSIEIATYDAQGGFMLCPEGRACKRTKPPVPRWDKLGEPLFRYPSRTLSGIRNHEAIRVPEG